MKKFTLVFAFMLLSFATVFAQEIDKPSMNKAKKYLDEGDLKMAKAHIEAYLESEKFKKKPKENAYVLQGEVYMAIATSENEADQALLDNPIEATLAAFDKVKEMSGGKGSDYDRVFVNDGVDETTFQIKPGLVEQFKNIFFTRAADAYNKEEDYKKAMKNFELAYKVVPTDTNAALYAYVSARQDDDAEGTARNAKKLMSLKYEKPEPYLVMGYEAYQAGQDLKADDKKEAAMKKYEEMLDYTEQGLAAVPDSLSGDLRQRQVQAYILLERMDDAIAKLKTNLEKDPDNITTIFTIGALYDEKGEEKEAMKYYDQALAKKPEYYEVNLNYAIIYLDEAKEVFKELDALFDKSGKVTDPEKEAKLSKEYDALLKKAIPYLETARKSKPQDLPVLQQLARAYQQLDMTEKYKEVAEAMNAID